MWQGSRAHAVALWLPFWQPDTPRKLWPGGPLALWLPFWQPNMAGIAGAFFSFFSPGAFLFTVGGGWNEMKSICPPEGPVPLKTMPPEGSPG